MLLIREGMLELPWGSLWPLCSTPGSSKLLKKGKTHLQFRDKKRKWFFPFLSSSLELPRGLQKRDSGSPESHNDSQVGLKIPSLLGSSTIIKMYCCPPPCPRKDLQCSQVPCSSLGGGGYCCTHFTTDPPGNQFRRSVPWPSISCQR